MPACALGIAKLNHCSRYILNSYAAFHLNNDRFDGVVGYHVSLTPVSSLKVSSSSLGRIILLPRLDGRSPGGIVWFCDRLHFCSIYILWPYYHFEAGCAASHGRPQQTPK
jgi:hypothetical protein